MGEVSVLVPTWLCARHGVGAIRSLRKFYPDIPVYIVDDAFKDTDVPVWYKLYKGEQFRSDVIYDPDWHKLIGLPNTCYIRNEHNGYETEGHGSAVTYAMNFIHTKWVIHLSSDARIVKDGIIEKLISLPEDFAGAGQFERCPDGYINLSNWLMSFRGDLYHEYNLDFMPDERVPIDAGTPMTTFLKNTGYKFNELLSDEMNEYCVHMRYKGDDEEWEALY